MKPKPLVPFFEGENKNFYKYPMNVTFLVLPKNFQEYNFENSDYEPGYFENIRNEWLHGMVRDRDSRFFELIVSDFLGETYDNLLRSILSKHGIFNYPFFRKNIRKQVVEQYAESNIYIGSFQKLLNELPQRSKWRDKPRGYYVTKDSNAIYVLIEHIYEQTLLRIIPNFKNSSSNLSGSEHVSIWKLSKHIIHSLKQKLTNNPPLKMTTISNQGVLQDAYSELELWFNKYSSPRNCNLCGSEYRVIDIPESYYFGSNGCTDCCFSCPVTLKPTKKELFSLIPAFVDACGFIPSSNIGPVNYSFTSQLPNERKIDVFYAYAQMGGIDHVKAKFGSWFKALAEVGVLPHDVLPTARGIRCLAKDGHICHSLAEQLIDNWLSDHQIPHEREPNYPIHQKFNENGRRRADWKVGDIFIEYFGLVGDENYDKKTIEKIQLAKHAGIHLISLYPSDLSNLDEKLVGLESF